MFFVVTILNESIIALETVFKMVKNQMISLCLLAKISVFTIFAAMFARKPKKFTLFLFLFIGFSSISLGSEKPSSELDYSKLLAVDSIRQEAKANFECYVADLYADLGDTNLLFTAFEQAMTGYHNLDKYQKLSRKEVLTVIDFSKPSNEKRLYIIDLCNRKILYKSIVAHGVNSGRVYAKHFSNENNSRQSSLGFYVTTSTYSGKYDLALRLDGMEHSNSHASSRGVVMHGAKYATYEFLEKNGSLGRSFGCPAMPYENFHQVVDWIKEGSCLFIYYPSRSYKRYSRYLNRSKYLEDFICI